MNCPYCAIYQRAIAEALDALASGDCGAAIAILIFDVEREIHLQTIRQERAARKAALDERNDPDLQMTGGHH